jgi:hypothetical protein
VSDSKLSKRILEWMKETESWFIDVWGIFFNYAMSGFGGET